MAGGAGGSSCRTGVLQAFCSPPLTPRRRSLAPPLQPLMLKDMRIQCRARGLNPGGSREALMERVRDHMLETGDT